jgi:hypothetical protein
LSTKTSDMPKYEVRSGKDHEPKESASRLRWLWPSLFTRGQGRLAVLGRLDRQHRLADLGRNTGS